MSKEDLQRQFTRNRTRSKNITSAEISVRIG